MDVSKLCRSCTKEVASWELNNFDQKAVEMFIFCTNVQITDDRMPRQFCLECTIKIESSYRYIKIAQDADVLLNNMVNRTVIVHPENQCKNLSVNQIQSIDKSEDKNETCDENNLYNLDDDDDESKHNSCTDNCIDDLVDLQIETTTKKSKLKGHRSKKKAKDTDVQHMIEVEHEDETNKQTCPFCEKYFVMSGFLKRHIRLKHPEYKTENTNHRDDEIRSENESKIETRGKRPNVCHLCKRIFMSDLWFSRHIETEHSDPRTYICRHCTKSFATKNQLRYHISLHSESVGFACSTCGKRFYRRKQLVAHSLTHTADRPFACDKCELTFKVKSVLAGHMKVHENEKAFLCYICGQGFAKAYTLTVHMHIHTGAKPHACTQCSFKASTSSSLRRHQRGHRAERKYLCPTCRRAYVDLSSLVRHRRTHTGERPYKCPHCTLTFIDSWKRKTHMMRSHGLALPEIPQLTRDGQPAAAKTLTKL